MSTPKPIIIVCGGQYGSEGKGMVAEALGRERGVRIAVRTGAVNAGHTIIHEGTPVKMQQLPCGWTNPDTTLVLGPGAYINPRILERECNQVSQILRRDIRGRLIIDPRAGIHLESHTAKSSISGRHYGIGATGKGCSEAIVDKIQGRKPGTEGYRNFSQTQWASEYQFRDTVEFLHGAYDAGEQILLEGTQGAQLDLLLGPYPYTTHKPCNASQWVVEAGLSPAMEYHVVLCLRTFPIRVAGNSGPMPGEISWPILADRINSFLLDRGKDPLVNPKAIAAFEHALLRATIKWPVPDRGMGGIQMHLWTPEERLQYKESLSELNDEALKSLPVDTVAELQKLFELTTVTHKLRRISEFDFDAARWAVMVNRPKTIVLTFFNYWRPDLWGVTSPIASDVWQEVPQEIREFENDIGHRVQYITTGPNPDNLIWVG